MPDILPVDTPGAPTTTRRPRVNPLTEYVSGTDQYAWSREYYRSLPQYVSDLDRDFGDDIWDQMLLDPQVASCVHLVKQAVLAQGLHFNPAVDDHDDRYEQAVQIADFCRRAFAGLGESLYPTLYDLLSALTHGNRVAELVYQRDAGNLTLKAIKPKPRRSVSFVVDPFMELVGLLAVIPEVAPTLPGTIVGVELTRVPNLLPRDKFLVLTFRGENNDPRGRSILRPAWNAWWIKTQGWPEYLKFASQFANPSIVAKLGPNATRMPSYLPDGSIETDAEGETVWVEPAQALLLALQEWRNSGLLVVPNGTEVDLLHVNDEGRVHQGLIEVCNVEISKAITGQTLATNEARFQARASSVIHQDVLGLTVDWSKKMLEGGLAWVCRQLVRLNYPPGVADLVPVVALSQTEKQDFPATATAVASLQKAGYFDPGQLPEVDALLNLPVRPPEAVEAAQAAQQQALEAAAGGAGEDEGEEEEPGAGGAEFGCEPLSGPASFGGPRPSASFDGPRPSHGNAGKPKFITLPGGRVIPLEEAQGGGRRGQSRTGSARGRESETEAERTSKAAPGGAPGASSAKGGQKAAARGPEAIPAPETAALQARGPGRKVSAVEQRYAEERNEAVLTAAFESAGGEARSFRDSEATDMVRFKDGVMTDGVELKTLLWSKTGQVKMGPEALAHKNAWMERHGLPFHTIIFDDRAAFEANGPGQHDESKRVIYYRRGIGNYTAGAAMQRVESMDHLIQLMETPNADLPKSARALSSYTGFSRG